MSLRARRFAGARLAAQPLETIPEQLQSALKNLREAGLKASDTPVPDDFPDYISKHRDVRGSTKKVHLLADPRRVNLADYIPEDLASTPANIAALEQLVAHPPRAVYDLSWEVDGSYAADNRVGRREAMRIAREAERGWQDIIPTLEEGSIVKNTPLGAQSGDFERADLYMKYGFGPVQTTMEQYGQVLGGKIVPISPAVPLETYVDHLASRAKAGGETELFGQLNANAQALQKLTNDVDVMARKRGASDMGPDYDDYYDDYDYDYEPEITIDDQRTREENVRDIQNQLTRMQDGDTWDVEEPQRQPIAIRERAKHQVRDEYLTDPIEAPSPQNVQQLREVQGDLMNLQQPAAIDVLNERFPRPLPQRLDADGSVQSGQQSIRRPESSNFRGLPADVRRQALAQNLRTNSSGQININDTIAARDAAKRQMVDMDSAENNQVGRVLQEFYTPDDVAGLRAVQEAAARNEGSPQNNAELPFNARGNNAGRSNPHFVQHGDRIQNRRALTPEQQAARRQLEPFAQAEANIRENLQVFENGMQANDRRGAALRQQRGLGSMQDIVSGVRPNAAMPGREALRILEQENAQPGTVARTNLGQALVNLQQIRNNGYRAIQAAAAGPQAIVDQANRGPMAPVQRTTPGRVTPPNRPPIDEDQQRRARAINRWDTSPRVPLDDDIPF